MSSYNNTFTPLIDPVSSVISCLCLVNNFILITIHVEFVHYPISRVTSDHKFLNRPARRTLHHWAYRLPVHTKQQLVVIASRCNWSFIHIIIPDYRCSSIIVIYSQIPTSIILCSILVLFGLSKFQMNKWKKKCTKY